MLLRGLFLGAAMTIGAGAATQDLVFTDLRTFFAVEVEVGNNTVAELFPQAPEWSVIFTFDNAKGYQAATRYPTGWSNSDLRIEPGQGAIFWNPRYERVQFTLAGVEPVEKAPIYNGWNLVSERSVGYPEPGGGASADGDEIIKRIGNQWTTNTFNGETGEWEAPFSPEAGKAVWFHTDAWPANPDGTFELSVGLYLNSLTGNPLYRNAGACVPDDTVMRVLLVTDRSSLKTQLGELVSLDQFGRVPDDANPFRYISFTAPVVTNQLDFIVDGEVVGWMSRGYRSPQKFLPNFSDPSVASQASPPRIPQFVVQPVSATPAPESRVELHAVYNFDVIPPNPKPSTSLTSVACGSEAECPIDYQWLKQTGPYSWAEVPGATSDTLVIDEFDTADQGTYRLQARWGNCYEGFSAAAMLGEGVPIVNVAQAVASGQVQILVSAPQREKTIEASADLESWTEVGSSGIDTWIYQAAKTGEFRFFRVMTAEPVVE